MNFVKSFVRCVTFQFDIKNSPIILRKNLQLWFDVQNEKWRNKKKRNILNPIYFLLHSSSLPLPSPTPSLLRSLRKTFYCEIRYDRTEGSRRVRGWFINMHRPRPREKAARKKEAAVDERDGHSIELISLGVWIT